MHFQMTSKPTKIIHFYVPIITGIVSFCFLALSKLYGVSTIKAFVTFVASCTEGNLASNPNRPRLNSEA